MKIGIAGTGRMGAAIARRLLGLGHNVVVWNRTGARTRDLAAAGAETVDRPADVTNVCESILTILTDGPAVEAVYAGPDGLLAGKASGKLFLEMSTVRPQTKKDVANRAHARGAAFLDCPVGGTVGPASEGKLLGMVGGEAGDLERARPILDQLCRRVEWVGPVGSAAALKLAMNLTVQVYWQAFGEALALCKPHGLPAQRLMELFTESSGAPRVFHHRAADIARTLEGGDIAPVNFDVDSVRKDMRTMIDEARAIGCSLPVAERALECFDLASREGLGEKDCATLPAIWWGRSNQHSLGKATS